MLAPFNNIIITTAEPAILPQVKRFFREHGFRPQAPRGDDIYIALQGRKLLAALRLSPQQDSWLLRSMCVHRDFRHQGIGRFMLEQMQTNLQRYNCYCFPYAHLKDFYQRAGFVSIDAQQLPESLADRYNAYQQQGKNILVMQYQGQQP